MITIEDNDRTGLTIDRSQANALLPIAGKAIRSLCSEHDGLLFFPQSIDETDDRIGDEHIFDIEWTANPDKAILKTGNIIGFISHGGQFVRICSRFDKQQDDYFLHYMLQRVFSFNLFDLKYTSTDEDVFNFLMFLFPVFLRRALRQGLYREYRRFEHNDFEVKGAVDIARHIKDNVPFKGTIAYSTREHSCDNAISELIRHTIEYMMTTRLGSDILNREETIGDVKLIRTITGTYNRAERQMLIQKNLRPRIHPYYTEYYPLQKLCIQILRHEDIKYGTDTDEIHGVLFDGAWLWEEYVNTLVKDLGFKHPENKKSTGGIYLFEGNSGKRYPDFYLEQKFVLDAKYKRYESLVMISKIDGNDLNQVISYMHVLNVSKGGFVCPLSQKEHVLPTATLKGVGGKISLYGIAIPPLADSFEIFSEMMSVQEDKFIKSIQLDL